jgi:hypothetical protein
MLCDTALILLCSLFFCTSILSSDLESFLSFFSSFFVSSFLLSCINSFSPLLSSTTPHTLHTLLPNHAVTTKILRNVTIIKVQCTLIAFFTILLYLDFYCFSLTVFYPISSFNWPDLAVRWRPSCK